MDTELRKSVEVPNAISKAVSNQLGKNMIKIPIYNGTILTQQIKFKASIFVSFLKSQK